MLVSVDDPKSAFFPAKTDKLEDFNSPSRSAWQIPDGVSPGTWDYVRAGPIASEYEEFLKHDPLTQLDWQIVCRWLPKVQPDVQRPTVIEFGCGNGRTLIPLIERGYQCIGVDLSMPMLREMEKKFRQHRDSVRSEETIRSASTVSRNQLTSVQANLVQLQCLQEDAVDHAVCLFSTLGMIRHHRFRRQFLDHARRIVRPRGTFILHAHNVWSQLRDRGGVQWLAKHMFNVATQKDEFGDRFSNYRGIRNMFIHSFRKRELIGLLEEAGFTVQKIYPVTRTLLDQVESWNNEDEAAIVAAIDQRRRTGTLKTIGWIIVCR